VCPSYYRARYCDATTGRFLSEDRLKSVSGTLDFYAYVDNSVPNLFDPSGFCPTSPGGEKPKCATNAKPDPRLRLVPISDCSHPGDRRIVYALQGPDGSSPTCWWVTEHVEPKEWAPAAPGLHSPEGQSTCNENNDAGGVDDHLAGPSSGVITQTFTISPQDPRAYPSTPSYPVIVQLPSGPNGRPQDYGTLGHFHQGMFTKHCINGNCTGFVPCVTAYDVPGSSQ